MTTRFLSPLNWILNGLTLILLAWSFGPGVSKTYSGVFAALMIGCVLGSQLCLAYMPEGSRLVSPRLRKWLLAAFALSAVLLVPSLTTSLNRARAERETAALSSELDRDMAKLETELLEFESKVPTRKQLDSMEAELQEIKLKRAKLKGTAR